MSGLVRWYRTPTGALLAALLAVAAVAAVAGYLEVVAFAVIVSVGVILPYKIDREHRERERQFAKLTHAEDRRRSPVEEQTLNELDRLAVDVAALTAQLKEGQQRGQERKRALAGQQERSAKVESTND